MEGKKKIPTHNSLNKKIYYKGIDGKTLAIIVACLFLPSFILTVVIIGSLLLFVGLIAVFIFLFISFTEKYKKKQETGTQDPLLQDIHLIGKRNISLRDTKK